MKKIINNPEHIVQEMCTGLVLAHPELDLLPQYKVITRKFLDLNKVSLISGGGSGHEPAHAGFVGKGMLDAAVCGDVFASPSQIQIYQAIRATATEKGTLLIIKNYSGDMMNFQNAAHLAQEDGIEVEYVKVDDDIAVQDSLYTVGRRGVAGTIFVHKIAGAAAEQGCSLQEVKLIAERVVANVKSIGFALTSCTVPAKGTPTFELADNEMEYGVGIHGEPGIQRDKVQTADELAARMVQSLCKELGITKGQRAALMVNGFGATPLMELYLLNASVAKELDKLGIVVARTFVGNYMTSIDMAGASLSLLKLDNELETLLNEPCEVPALQVTGPVEVLPYADPYAGEEATAEACYEIETPIAYSQVGERFTLQNMIYTVDAIGAICIRNEIPFCDLDSFAGDGDFGMSVAKGFKELKRQWKRVLDASGDSIGAFLHECSLIIMEHCGGASGPIWGSAFRAAGKQVGDQDSLSVADMADLLQATVKGIQLTGERSFGRGAVVGDKTLIDALAPCADAWSEAAQTGAGFAAAFEAGAAAAVDGAKRTESITARMGRAGTVGERSLGHPDAGAHALGVIFTELAGELKFS